MKEKQRFIIYKVTNQVNGKIYIGQTVQTIGRRKTEHLRDSKRGLKGYFNNAIRKHKADVFVWERICRCATKKEADLRAAELGNEYEAEQRHRLEHTKENDKRTWAWNAAYHHRKIK